MFIQDTISHLGGIGILEERYSNEIKELHELVSRASLPVISFPKEADTLMDNTQNSDGKKSLGLAGAASIGAGTLGHLAAANAGIGVYTALASGASSLGLGFAGITALTAMFGPLAVGLPAVLAGASVLARRSNKKGGVGNDLKIDDIHLALIRKGWSPKVSASNNHSMGVGHIKNRLGLEFILPGMNALAMSMFFNLQSSARRDEIDIAVIVLQSIGKTIAEQKDFILEIETLLKELSPLPIQTPFVILVIGKNKIVNPPTSLTQDIDTILVKRTGLFYDDILTSRESETLEFKRELNKPVIKKLVHTAVAFSNSQGGAILIGVDDNGCEYGIPEDKINDYELPLMDAFRHIEPKIYPTTKTVLTKNNKYIIAIDIPPSTAKDPVTASGTVYIRNGTQTLPAGPSEITSLVLKRRQRGNN
jgi:hypothetical protein